MNIYWYCPPSVMADFKDPLDNPSFRLRCFLIHQKLLENGYNSQIVSDARLINNPHIVVLMSFGEMEYNIAKTVSSWGASVIHDYSENIRGIPILEATKKLCKFLVCCSNRLRDEEAKVYGDRAVVVKDPFEESVIIHNPNIDSKKLKVVWAGMSGNAPFVEELLKPLIEKVGMEYVEISNRSNSNIRWSKDWQYQMAKCDIAICPHNHWTFPAKSNVKVTVAMSLGLPVIASPLESYLEIIDNGSNGYIAYTLEDWEIYLNNLKDKKLRNEFTAKSFDKLEPYKVENIYKQWLDIFKRA